MNVALTHVAESKSCQEMLREYDYKKLAKK